jgi:hypothetical protein
MIAPAPVTPPNTPPISTHRALTDFAFQSFFANLTTPPTFLIFTTRTALPETNVPTAPTQRMTLTHPTLAVAARVGCGDSAEAHAVPTAAVAHDDKHACHERPLHIPVSRFRKLLRRRRNLFRPETIVHNQVRCWLKVLTAADERLAHRASRLSGRTFLRRSALPRASRSGGLKRTHHGATHRWERK